jgi:Holliday junction resolvase RusA-like endonuclease
MMDTRSFVLPYPPSANRYWRTDRGGKPHLSDEAKLYKLISADLARGTPISGDVKLVAHVFRPQKSGDLSNRIKVLEDVLRGIAYVDDKQTAVIEFHRWDDARNPRVQVDVLPAVNRGAPPPCRFVSPEAQARFERARTQLEAFAEARAKHETGRRNAREAAKALATTPRRFKAVPNAFGRRR